MADSWFDQVLKLLGLKNSAPEASRTATGKSCPDNAADFDKKSSQENPPACLHDNSETHTFVDSCHASEDLDDISQADFDFELARRASSEGDYDHAAFHLAWALAKRPEKKEWLKLLDELIAASEGKLLLLPAGANQTSYAEEALRAYTAFRAGDINKAVVSICSVTSAKPDSQYIRAWLISWLASDEILLKLEEDSLAAMMSALQKYREYYESACSDRNEMKEVLAILDRYLALKKDERFNNEYVLYSRVALMRKSGKFEEAISEALKLFKSKPSYLYAICVATAYKNADQSENAIEWYEKALGLAQNNNAALLDIGDLHLRNGKIEAALKAYEKALELDPSDHWALPSIYYCRFKLNSDESWLRKLEQLENSGSNRAYDLLNLLRPYTGYLPEAQEATASLLKQLLASGNKNSKIKSIAVSALEAPSCFLAVNMQLEHMGFAKIEGITVLEIQNPDPRLPVNGAGNLLWSYDGTIAIPVKRPYSEKVRDAVLKLASQAYDYRYNWIEAKKTSEALSKEPLESWLGVMLEPPAPAEAEAKNTNDCMMMLNWLRRVQLASAYVIANSDDGIENWLDSPAKRLLFEIIRGPIDWTVDSAVIALSRVAQERPECRDAIRKLYLELLERTPEKGYSCFLYPLLYNWLLIPGLPQEERKSVLKKLESYSS